MSIWDAHGRIRIEVEQRHIERALERNSSHCAVAEAIKEAIPDARFIAVDLQCIRFSRRGLRYVFLTPHLARDCIVNFDQGLRDLLKPFALKLRPAVIAKAGKKRTHTPTNGELRGTGLTVNKTQPHLDPEKPNRSLDRSLDKWGRPASAKMVGESKAELRREFEQAWCNTAQETQRFNADGSDRVDGLFVPPPPKRRPSVARAMVSTAPKGSVPVTLGGKLPPTSILSRREYGLRLLRR
jgi:hypothetical protein